LVISFLEINQVYKTSYKTDSKTRKISNTKQLKQVEKNQINILLWLFDLKTLNAIL